MSTLPSPVVSDNPQAVSGPRTVYLDRQDVPEVFRLAFPSYRGRQYRVTAAESVMLDANYWSGGTKYTYRGVDLLTGKVLPPDCDEYGNPFVRPEVPTVAIEPGRAIVCHKVFCGKDLGLTIYVHPDNLAKLLPKPAELTGHEQTVLSHTASLKSSYGGISNYRFHEAHQRTGITLAEWDTAKQSLIAKGLLDKRGAITTKGRNALATAGK
ncbi:MAG: hypothetical protein ABIP48_02310 [Planctomycetota bacterium]